MSIDNYLYQKPPWFSPVTTVTIKRMVADQAQLQSTSDRGGRDHGGRGGWGGWGARGAWGQVRGRGGTGTAKKERLKMQLG